jgi:hypothetical protein
LTNKGFRGIILNVEERGTAIPRRKERNKTMKKTLTVNQLIECLTAMKEQGYGENPVLYMDEDSMVHEIEEGTHDVWDDGAVILG